MAPPPDRRARDARPPRPTPPLISPVLILKPCCLGDVLMATPLAAALHEALEARGQPPIIDWAVDRHSRPALQGSPHLRQLLDASHVIRGDLRPAALLRLLGQMRRGGYQSLFVPDRSPILSLLASLSGIPRRYGLASGWRGFGYTLRAPTSPADQRHEAEIYLDLARALGIAEPAARSVFVPDEQARERAREILEALDPDAATISPLRVAIHPGGGVNPGMHLPEKRWPVERFAAIAERLVAERGARVLLVGGPGDRPLAAALREAIAPDRRAAVTDLSGQLDWSELAALVERCALYLGNDTGATKLAAAVGTPVVEIFGPTDPGRYGPLPGTGRGAAVEPVGGARPPGRLAEATGSTAIETVTVEQVWTAVLEQLSANEGTRAAPGR